MARSGPVDSDAAARAAAAQQFLRDGAEAANRGELASADLILTRGQEPGGLKTLNVRGEFTIKGLPDGKMSPGDAKLLVDALVEEEFTPTQNRSAINSSGLNDDQRDALLRAV